MYAIRSYYDSSWTIGARRAVQDQRRNDPMSTHIPADIQQAADITHITQLILTERESRDTGQWDLV